MPRGGSFARDGWATMTDVRDFYRAGTAGRGAGNGTGDRAGPMIHDETAISACIASMNRTRLLVLGDVMLDSYAFGTVDRISPEAPIPVLSLDSRRIVLGGAGNVLRNLTSLGTVATVAGVVGDDEDGRRVIELLETCGSDTSGIEIEAGRPTTLKQRFVAGGQQLLRVDREVTHPIRAETRARLAGFLSASMPGFDLVVLSDYHKGIVTPDLARTAIAAAAMAGKPVIVDPKGRDYDHYAGAFLVTPNARELQEVTGLPTREDAQVETACRKLIERIGVGGILATRSERGMTLVMADEPAIHLRSHARDVADVTGAGDTVVAVLAAALAAGMAPPQAAYLANVAAGIVVGKVGAAAVRPDELVAKLQETAMLNETTKIIAAADLPAVLERCRAGGLSIGFTNGCFDLLHPGHLSLLRQARAACDYLVVGLNGDASVKRLKGPARPIRDQAARAAVLASLAVVDRVVVFDEDTPEALIKLLRPDVLVKGADYRPDQVVGAAFVESYGGRLVLARLERGFSTTSTVARIAGHAAEMAG